MNTPNDSHTGPVVGPERTLDEVTVKGVLLGLVLAALLAAANAYLGLRVGMTVAASIPAAAVSLGVLRMFKRSTILENNQVQTIASAGASVVSGVIFTIPALVMMGAWDSYRFWPMVGLASLGGVLGVVFSVPLRRALIVDMNLAFPEGVATAEVLKTGPVDTATDVEKDSKLGKQGFRLLLEATGFAAAFKLVEGGFHRMAESVATAKLWLSGKWLFTADATLAPSLLGVGYLVGLNIGTLVFMGAVIGTIVAVPIHWWLHTAEVLGDAGLDPTLAMSAVPSESWGDVAGAAFKDCRRIGVGAMIVGGIWSILNLLKPLAAGVRASIHAMKSSTAGGGGIPRTERDTPFSILLIVLAVTVIPLYFCFYSVIEGVASRELVAGVMTVLVFVFGFLFTAVAGYMAGLVGSSNNPVSGVTMATVIASALVLSALIGTDGDMAKIGPAAVIVLASIICTGACIAGDNLQDLKCGHVVGSTPWKQQACLVLGAVVSALVIPGVMATLDASQGIGRAIKEGVVPFGAPQANLMKDVSTAIFGEGLDWRFIGVGCVLAVVLIVLDKIQEARKSDFRFPVLAVAVGIYLPFGLSVLIFVGGVLNWWVNRASKSQPAQVRQDRENVGLILASGLVTGESLMGVAVALAAANASAEFMNWRADFADPLTIVVIALMCVYLVVRTLRSSRA
jgi:putative OPT family oligopeptide transporter